MVSENRYCLIKKRKKIIGAKTYLGNYKYSRTYPKWIMETSSNLKKVKLFNNV